MVGTEPIGAKLPLPTLMHSLQLETLVVSEAFDWFLECYRFVSDPAFYSLAHHSFESSRREPWTK